MSECRRVERRADHLVAGTLANARVRVLERHAEDCSACADLLNVLLAPQDAPVDLVPALRREHPGACAQAREHLVDPSLADAFGASLVDAHVESCRECTGFARALQLADATLPELVDIDPGAAFTWRVLEATSGARAEIVEPAKPGALARLWQELLGRPRAAMEFSYAFMLLLVIGFGTPVSPGAGLPAQALEWFGGVIGGGEESPAWVEDGLLPITTSPVRLVEASGAAVSARAEQVDPVLSSFGAHLGAFGRALTEREWTRVRLLATEMQCDMTLLLRGIRGRLEEPADREC